MSGKLVLLQSEVQTRKAAFESRYADAEGRQSFYNELNIPWTAFRDAAMAGADPDKLIMHFTHRYDTGTYNWYLTAQQYSFDGYSGPKEYPMTAGSTLFNMLPDGSIGDYDGGMQDHNGHYYDPAYFDNIRFEGNPIDYNSYANGLSFAWEEMKQLHCDNRNAISKPNDALFTIRFCSISSDYTGMPQDALVPFPHCIGMYMCYNGSPCLNDDPTPPGAVFVNKAADQGSICPPRCASYDWPAGLLPKSC